jgi:hypothetical protein
MQARRAAAVLLLSTVDALAATGFVENPQPDSVQSGITLISGWVCGPAAVSASFDGGAPINVPWGGERVDTVGQCGGPINNGFGLLYNYNRLAPGSHTIRVFVNGVQLGGDVAFTVRNLGSEFIEGLQGRRYLDNFPSYGRRTIVEWQQSKQNFGIVGVDDNEPDIAGNYYGTNTYTLSGCPANNGDLNVQDADYAVSFDSSGGTIIVQKAVASGDVCTIRGALYYLFDSGQLALADATYACSKGGQTGTMSIPRIYVTPVGFNFEYTRALSPGCMESGRAGGIRQ